MILVVMNGFVQLVNEDYDMKRLILILLLTFSSTCFGVNTWIIGGRGDMTGANALNGGGWTGSTRTWTDSQGTNGDPIVDISDGDCSDSGQQYGLGYNCVRLTNSGEFVNALVDVYAHVEFTATYSDGRYLVMAVDGSGNYIDIALEFSSADPDITMCKIGGALSGDAAINTMLAGVAAGDIVKVAGDTSSATTYTITATWTSTVDATRAAPITFEGVDKTDGALMTYGIDALPIITTENSLTNGLVWWNGADYWISRCVDLNGNGAGKGRYCLRAGAYNWVLNCIIRGADYSGLLANTGNYIAQCDIHTNNASAGAQGGAYSGAATHFEGNYIHDNTGDGCLITANDNVVLDNNIIYDNSGHGCSIGAAGNYNTIRYNTFDRNGGNGIDVDAAALYSTISDNSIGNSGGYNYDFNGAITTLIVFARNHSYNGTSGHWSEGADETWATAVHGNNIAGDPLFTSVVDGSENYLPASGSPLIEAGINNFTIGAITRATDYPSTANTLSDDTVDGAAGTFVNIAEEHVELNEQWGAGGTEFTGSLAAGGCVDWTLPEPNKVVALTEYGPIADPCVGTRIEPDPCDVRYLTEYGPPEVLKIGKLCPGDPCYYIAGYGLGAMWGDPVQYEFTGEYAEALEAYYKSAETYGYHAKRVGTYDPCAAAVYPAEADVWHDTGAYGPKGVEYTPAMVGSDIENLEPANVRIDVEVDDVTGTLKPGCGG